MTDNASIKMTPLRNDVLLILKQSPKAMSAYEILKVLKKKRPNAEPPTVYRVLEFFSDNNIIHRIATDNKFVLCEQQHPEKNEQTVILICSKCHKPQEVLDNKAIKAIKDLANKHQFQLSGTTIELSGVCQQCH